MTALIIILRIVHIVSGVLWVGGVVMVAAFIMPSINAAGPAGPAVMKQMVQVRRMPIRLLGLAIVAIVAGLLLFWLDTRNSLGAFPGSAFGRGIGFGALLAIIAVLIGAFVSLPTANRLGQVGAEVHGRGGSPTEAEAAQIAHLQRRLGIAARTVAVLVLLATTLMAISRYL